MGFDELCLTWDDHHKTLIGVFEALLESSTLVDCTIAAEGQYLKAHKVVLSACSPYFEMLFTQESEKNPIVVLKDIKFQDLKSLIDFIYRGKVQIPEDRLGDFTDAAESLQIKGLGGGQKRNACEKRGRESPSLPTKEVQILPIARKRSRTVFPRSEEKQCESPNAVNTSRSRRKENVTLSQSMDCATPVLPSSPSDSSSAPPHLGKAQKELREVRPSSSTARSSICNIETDPEPMTEIFLPETLVEPKSEVCIDETSMMASEDGEEMILGEHLDNDESENSALSSSHGVLKQETNNSFTIEPVAEHSNAGAEGLNFFGSAASALKRRGGELMQRLSDAPIRGEEDEQEDEEDDTIESRVVRRRSAARRTASFAWNSEIVVETLADSLPAEGLRTRGGGGRLAASASALGLPLGAVHDERLPCNECGRTFACRASLRVHKRKHTGLRPFRCEDCGKAFFTSWDLVVHRRIHTGEMPFQCQYCPLRFRNSSRFHAHMRKDHKGLPVGAAIRSPGRPPTYSVMSQPT